MKIPQNDNRLIRIPLPKGCYLLLTWAEYERALLRAKAERRRERNEKRTHPIEFQASIASGQPS